MLALGIGKIITLVFLTQSNLTNYEKIILISLSVILALIIGVVLYGVLVVSKKSPIKTTEFSSNGLDLKVVYCQPYKKVV